MGSELMEPIFGEVTTELSAATLAIPLQPFLFYVHGLENENSTLRVIATDFHSNTFQANKSRSQLEDMRDDVGIGGTWSDFMDYLISSLRSKDVKLILNGQAKPGGAVSAKLIAQKAKGMPRILISLSKVVDAAANEAMANLSLELFKEFKNVKSSLVEEERRCCELTKVLSAEQEKNNSMQKHLDIIVNSKRHKSWNLNENTTSDGISTTTSQDSPGKQGIQNPGSMKVASRVVPTHRRAKVRGAVLQDSDDDAQS